MTSDIKDSIKARLYDMKYTPFLASYLFSWLFFNAKSILIFFSDKLSITQKIDMLSYDSLDYQTPLYFALFYTIIFPLFSAVFYFVTLQYKRLMNYIKQKIQDVTPLPQEEANKIIKENIDLELNLNSKIAEINKLKADIENKMNNYLQKEKELEKNINVKIKLATQQLKDENTKLLKQITKQDEEIKTLKKENKSLKIKSMNNKTNTNNLNSELTNDEIELLRIIYENNITRYYHSSYINAILKTINNKFKRIKIQDLIDSLVKKDIIKNINNEKYDISDKGKKEILKLFDKEHNNTLEDE